MDIRTNSTLNIKSALAGLILLIFSHLFFDYVHADQKSDDEELAKKFAPILVLTSNPDADYMVLNPEFERGCVVCMPSGVGRYYPVELTAL